MKTAVGGPDRQSPWPALAIAAGIIAASVLAFSYAVGDPTPPPLEIPCSENPALCAPATSGQSSP